MQNWVENRMGRIMGRRLTIFSVALSGVLVAHFAYAVDGVAEINHTCAVMTGCFSGDTAGYPITLDGSAGASYRLTSNLVVPDVNTNGIQIAAPSLTIDLNGFEIVGSACVLALDMCRPGAGGGSGIVRMNEEFRGTTVKNGSITGMGFWGVRLGRQSEVRGMRVRWNAVDGIFVGHASIVSENTSYENGVHGIVAGSGSTVSNNSSFGNVRDGIFSTLGSTIEGNSVMENGEDGISALSGTHVRGNTARSNSGFGLSLSASSVYRENVLSDNGLGSVNGGIDLLGNSCKGTATCP